MTTEYRYSTKEVKQLARGRWLHILPALGGNSELFAKSGKRVGRHYQGVECPICGGTDRYGLLPSFVETGASHCRHCGAFRDGFELLQKINGWTLAWATKEVAEYIGGGACAEPVARVGGGVAEPIGKTLDEQERTRYSINKILRESSQLPSEVHRAYFQNRGIPAAADLRSASLLYHPGLSYRVNKKPLLDENGRWKTWPAIIGRVSSSKGWLGLQWIYLTKDGRKAGDEIAQAIADAGLDANGESKRMLAINSMVGGAVRLGKAGKTLAVCEGVETGLAVSIGLGGFMGVAAAGTANLLSALEIPDRVERLLVFADKDIGGTGLRAAEALRERVRHNIEVEILMPDMAIPDGKSGIDWLDALNQDANALSTLANRLL